LGEKNLQILQFLDWKKSLGMNVINDVVAHVSVQVREDKNRTPNIHRLSLGLEIKHELTDSSDELDQGMWLV
jgi:hypothetical protein